jgi:hypothetical protein
MGMGAAPAHGWVISDEDLKTLVPVQFAKLEQLLESDDELGGLDGLAFQLSVDGPIDKKISEAYADLADAFEQATTVEDRSHLVIDLQFYDADRGDRYDELENGHYWDVTGVEMLTPAGLKFKEVVEHKMWTQFG